MKSKVKAKFIKRCDDVPYKEVEGEFLLLNLKDGNYYGLNQTAMAIWKMLNGTKAFSDIVKAVVKRFKLKEDAARRHTSDLLKELKRHNLIEFFSSKSGYCQKTYKRAPRKPRR